MKGGKDFWSEHVAGVKREGGPAKAYAQRHGISVASLYYWQRKLNKWRGHK
jgi:transposase-like protein